MTSQIGDSKLKKLWLSGVDLTSITPEVLMGGIQRQVMIWFANLSVTADQANAILSMLSEGRQERLNKILIYRPALIGGTVSPVLLQSAREVGGQNLEYLDIEFD